MAFFNYLRGPKSASLIKKILTILLNSVLCRKLKISNGISWFWDLESPFIQYSIQFFRKLKQYISKIAGISLLFLSRKKYLKYHQPQFYYHYNYHYYYFYHYYYHCNYHYKYDNHSLGGSFQGQGQEICVTLRVNRCRIPRYSSCFFLSPIRPYMKSVQIHGAFCLMWTSSDKLQEKKTKILRIQSPIPGLSINF